MTYFTTESWHNYYDTRSARIKIEDYLNSPEYKETKEEILFLLEENSVEKRMSESVIIFTINLIGSKIIDKLVKKLARKKLDTLIRKTLIHYYQKIGNTILKNVIKKIKSYLSKLAIKKWIILATSWASPAFFFVSRLDSILSWNELFIDLLFYRIYI